HQRQFVGPRERNALLGEQLEHGILDSPLGVIRGQIGRHPRRIDLAHHPVVQFVFELNDFPTHERPRSIRDHRLVAGDVAGRRGSRNRRGNSRGVFTLIRVSDGRAAHSRQSPALKSAISHNHALYSSAAVSGAQPADSPAWTISRTGTSSRGPFPLLSGRSAAGSWPLTSEYDG